MAVADRVALPQDLSSSREPRWSGVLTVGFGTAVAMWAIGYFGRLPAVLAPSPLLLVLLLACLVGGGAVLGRHAGASWREGAAAGTVTGLLNLLVLGSFVSGERPNELVPSALLWLPGSVLVSALLSAGGAVVVRRWRRRHDPALHDWSGAFVGVSIASVLLLLGVGGLVTSAGAGLAVADWPNSFRYNMFLYPFSRMTGGIYYEHAHRLFGALVGLTTLALALLLQAQESRRWVRMLGWAVWGMVVVQGVLGGLRVTGTFTLSTSSEALRPNLALALVHGVFGQIVFAVLVALGVFTSREWRSHRQPQSHPTATTARWLGALLLGSILVQLVLGAVQRHLSELLIVHMVVGVGVVAPLAAHVGFRTWGLHGDHAVLRRVGLALVGAVLVQVGLGLGAFAASRVAGSDPEGLELALSTAHQWFGAVLLGLAVMLQCWNTRVLAPAPRAVLRSRS
jgi:cytochrome c oxidase assembly protein subunit 15